MVTLNAGTLTNPKKGDMEQKNNFMKNKLGATIRLGSRVQNWIAFEIIYFLGLFIQGTVFNYILTLILMPDICGQCGHPKVTAITLVVLVALVQILQVFRFFDYLGFLFCSSLALLLASFTIHRGKTTVTLLQQMRRGWTDDDVAIIEENFPRMGDLGETTDYELGLVILWILLSAIIQMYTMKQQKAVQKQKKKEKSRVEPTVEVYTIKPINMTLEEKKKEELTEIPDHDQLYANSIKVRFLDEKKEYEPDN